MAKSGLEYWRSLDELADTSEFRHWVESEFPSAYEETSDPVSRRHFVKIMSASFLMAGVGLTGCRRPESKILPFSRMPEDYTHGSAQFFATAMPTRSSAVPLLIKSVDGRPIKAEGNPDHPGGTRGTDIFAQASLLNLFDPDRSQHILADGKKALRLSALDKLKVLAGTLKAEQGAGLAILRESSTSPSRHRIESSLREIWPQAKWYLDDTVDDSAVDRAASSLYGSSLVTDYDFSKAKVVLSLDNDFMMLEPDSFRHIKGYASARRVLNPEDSMNRLYTVESGMTVTGSNADHRLKIAAGEVAGIVSRLASYIANKNVGVRGNTEASGFLEKTKTAGNRAENHSGWIEGCADDLLENAGACLVVAGNHQPESIHVLVHAINEALGNVGKTVTYREAPENESGNLKDLVSSLKKDEVKTLVILGANPAYTAPVDLEWSKVQESAESIIRLAYYEDETTAQCNWQFPQAHYLESWGDARTRQGSLAAVQPLIEPLFGGITELEFLALLGGLEVSNPYEIVRETFKSVIQEEDVFENSWRSFLHNGFHEKAVAVAIESPTFSWGNASRGLNGLPAAEDALSEENLQVIFKRDLLIQGAIYGLELIQGWRCISQSQT
ncbi:MAG TPA: hypothetical protein EYQ50_22180, partial [Verrucomicrobiales bacterium]|nr:hypothetical protein [Verrucomicrobiales bacterium]